MGLDSCMGFVFKVYCFFFGILQMESGEFPAWLEVLLKDKFFNACLDHEDDKKNEKNILCIDCCLTICPHCLSSHTSHRLLQVSLLK